MDPQSRVVADHVVRWPLPGIPLYKTAPRVISRDFK